MWVFDVDTLAFLDVNEAAVSQYGYSRAQFLEMTITQIRPPEDWALLQAFMHNHTCHDCKASTWRHVKADGSFIWVSVVCFPMQYKGRVAKIVTATDITAVKEQEAAVRQSETQLDTLLNTTNSPHLFFDSRLYLQAYNRVAADFAREKIGIKLRRGMSIRRVAQGNFRNAFIYACQQALNGINTLNKEVEMIPGHMWLLVNYLTARDSFGNIVGVAFTAIDITEQKKAEAKISQQNMALSEIAWKQSHIVRAPLANILCLTSLLAQTPGDTQLLSSLQEESHKLDGIIRDIVEQTSALYHSADRSDSQPLKTAPRLPS